MTTKIYKIWSPNGDKVYIGSTDKTGSQRYSDHKSTYKSKRNVCTSVLLFEEYGIENCVFTLLEEFEKKEDRTFRFQRERFYLEQYPTAVNQSRPAMTPEDEKKLKHDWYVNDKKENPEVYKQRNKENYEESKEENSKPIPCLCGVSYTHPKKKRHESTAHHIKVMAMTEEERAVFFNTPKETKKEAQARWFKEKYADEEFRKKQLAKGSSEKVKARRNELHKLKEKPKVICECGDEVIDVCLSNHKKTKRHLKWATAQTETDSPE